MTLALGANLENLTLIGTGGFSAIALIYGSLLPRARKTADGRNYELSGDTREPSGRLSIVPTDAEEQKSERD
jgi:hypothetical protein